MCESRLPKMVTLYDCFAAIHDDEDENVKTMKYLQQNGELTSMKDVTSPRVDDGFVFL